MEKILWILIRRSFQRYDILKVKEKVVINLLVNTVNFSGPVRVCHFSFINTFSTQKE